MEVEFCEHDIAWLSAPLRNTQVVLKFPKILSWKFQIINSICMYFAHENCEYIFTHMVIFPNFIISELYI